METAIVLLVTVLIGLTVFFYIKSILSNSNEKKTLSNGNSLSREEIKEKFSQLNSLATQVRI